MADDEKEDITVTTIYFAGSLFTHAERIWNLQVADQLEALGLRVILPQITSVPALSESPSDFERVRDICLEGIDEADVVVAILDGADSDSGTCFECGYAYAKGTPIVGIRTDLREGEDGGLNAMLARSCDEVVRFSAVNDAAGSIAELGSKISSAVHRAAEV